MSGGYGAASRSRGKRRFKFIKEFESPSNYFDKDYLFIEESLGALESAFNLYCSKLRLIPNKSAALA